MDELDEIINTVDYGTPKEAPLSKYSEFDMKIFADLKALGDVEAILPQVYLSLQHQLRDPKIPANDRKILQKRAMQFEGLMSPGIDKVWKISSKKTYDALVEKIELERLKKNMLKKMESTV